MLKKSNSLLRIITFGLIAGIVHFNGFAGNLLSCSTNWIKPEGAVTTRKGCNGRAQTGEIEVDGPNRHCDEITLFIEI